MAKRAFDIFFAAIGLIVLSPLLLALALAVRLDSPGPALFRQERVGRGGRTFRILKFRSMCDGADAQGSQVTAQGDARITRMGRLLRHTKLDELPQLWNVLAGDMSFVGPRPEVPKYVAVYPPGTRETVLSVRPGITDNASIQFRNESEYLARFPDPERAYVEDVLPRKLALYERYVHERSFLGDLRIIGQTLASVVRG